MTPRWRLLLTMLTLLAAIGFIVLGLWQLERRVWKLALIARVDARVTAPAVALPNSAQWPATTRDDAEYRHVTAQGIFDHRRETLVRAVTDLGPGFWVLTPLQTTDGAVLVNRGFVPSERRAPQSRTAGQLAGPLTVVGLLRTSEPGGGFLRNNDPANDRWFSRDVAGIARKRGLILVAPYFIDADATPNPGGWPRGGLTVVRFRNAHLTYALTWFALAALAGWAAARLSCAR